MGSDVSRRNFVALGAAAIGGLTTAPALAAKLVHPRQAKQLSVPTSHSVGKHLKTTHHTRVMRGGEESSALNESDALNESFESTGVTPKVPARPLTSERFVSLVNAHTKEGLHAVYWRNGTYLPEAMRQVNLVLRDHMSGDIHTMDPRLVDLLGDLRQEVATTEPWTVISGYRSPRTNAWLHRHSCGVAAHSLHVQGRAADIILAGENTWALHNAALKLGEGGVGYYPRSGFVHVDTGKVREWAFE